jgi:hypothetical protein
VPVGVGHYRHRQGQEELFKKIISLKL